LTAYFQDQAAQKRWDQATQCEKGRAMKLACQQGARFPVAPGGSAGTAGGAGKAGLSTGAWVGVAVAVVVVVVVALAAALAWWRQHRDSKNYSILLESDVDRIIANQEQLVQDQKDEQAERQRRVVDTQQIFDQVMSEQKQHRETRKIAQKDKDMRQPRITPEQSAARARHRKQYRKKVRANVQQRLKLLNNKKK